MTDEATARQIIAADPRNSTWLAANAGSGKTRVLTNRVARLLLEPVDPQNILCLTYTKAAASEMQNRLFQTLGAWAMMPDPDLRQDLAKLGFDRAITAKELRRARRLFAQAIETPGGLKIQTIHAFCASVLRRFPLEAGVSPQFREMEDRQADLLRADVADDLLEGPHADAVHAMLAHFTGSDLSRLTAEISKNATLFATAQGAPHAALGLAEEATSEDALDIAFTGDEPDIALAVSSAFADQSPTYVAFAADLQALDLQNPDMQTLERLFSLFLYASDSTSKSRNFPQSGHKKAVTAMAPIAAEVHAWMDRVAAAKQHLYAIDTLARAQALHAFAAVFLPAYAVSKSAMGLLDFDDLIQKTRKLLTDRHVAQWVLFRLDGGIDHVLVDEAQDTSPDQWEVIRQLTAEFTAGDGADPDRGRTVFVVGDRKQSIYSFQGADPDAFDEMRDHFATGLSAVGKGLQTEALLHSFRSSQAILRVVDETFRGERKSGLEPKVQHVAFKHNMPGRVDLWPMIAKADAKPQHDWKAPIDAISPEHHDVKLAQRIADTIAGMIKTETLPVEIGRTDTYARRPITPGDILILVQRRSGLFAEIIRACKKAGLDIAGSDRLRVAAELAVKDILALLSFLALPEDDLSLACALKSPLFGWTEQDLFTLAHHRPEKGYLWPALRDAAGHDDTRAVLQDLLQRADFLRPYDLIARILGRHDGRRKLVARLGPEAEDGIDALLSQALTYESTGVPSLTGFLSWMATDELEVKRQMDTQGNRIRVMTAHGAKGLEAPIVILPDTAARSNDVKQDILNADGMPLWKPRAEVTPETVARVKDHIRNRAAQERLRLLYVAMTRAEKWLIVAGAGEVKDDDDSWYNIVADGMQHAGAGIVHVAGQDIQRIAHLDWDQGELRQEPEPIKPEIALPTFGDLPNIDRPTTLAPSDLGGAKVMAGDTGGGDDDVGLTRGSMIHLLLEHLPGAPADRRAEIGRGLLAGLSDAAEADTLVAQVLDLLDTPSLAAIFAPGALTEVDVSASLPSLSGQRVRGTIDRLIVHDDHVLVVDYKTNRLVPNTPANVPLGLLRQMGAYHQALTQVFPAHRIDTAILWTETAQLMHLPADLVRAALNEVKPA